MKVIKLRTKSKNIQLTAKESLQEAMNSSFDSDSALIILYREDDKDIPEYEFWQGGGLDVKEMLWHVEQFKIALLEGRLEEFSDA